jgi:iron complex outermembrane receptor protein
MKKSLSLSSAVIFIFLMIITAPLRAQDPPGTEASPTVSEEYQFFDLGEIFVTAEKLPAVTDMTVTTEITAEEMKSTNSRTVAEALSYVPGVNVSAGRKNQPNIEIRGLDQSLALILIDGVPYYETNYGKLDLNQIPVDNIAKIEVIKGDASVLYGPNAMAGVINIITKKPTEKPSAQAIVEIGDFASYKASVSNGMKVGIFNYWLNYVHQESNGWRMSDDFEPRLTTIMRKPGGTTQAIVEDGGLRNNSDFNTNSVWAKFGIEPNPNSEYYLNFHYIAKEKGVPPSTDSETVFPQRPAFSTFARIPKYDDWGIDLSGQQKIINELTLKAKLFYHNHLDDYASYSDQTYKDQIALSRFKDYLVGGILSADYRPVDWNIVRFALNYRGDSHKERADSYLPFADDFSYTGSVALENEFDKVKNLSVVAGAGYDWFNVTRATKNVTDKNTGDFVNQEDESKPGVMHEFDPMIGATYKLDDSTRVFGSVARKVRFPTLDQLYSSKSGNVNLTAEKSINYTLGASRSFGKFASGELALFYYDISDFITRDAPGTLGVYRNFAKIRMLGFEVNGQINPAQDLYITAGYTYNDAEDRSDGRVTDSVLFVPRNKVDIGLNYTVPYIITRVDLTALYESASFNQLPTPQYPDQEVIKTGDHFVMNARVSKTFLKRYEAYVAINNIFDSDYESELGFPGPGRNFYFGFSVKL